MKLLTLFFLLTFLINFSFGQLFYHLQQGRSTASIGLGEQNSTLADPINAMAGNPANLVYENGATVFFFRNPVYFFGGIKAPIENLAASFNFKNKIYFGIEFSSWSFPDAIYTDASGSQKKISLYEKAYSFSSARKISENLSIGLKLTYGKNGDFIKADHIMVSAGGSYFTKFLSRDLMVGMSFMNFGLNSKVKTMDGDDYYIENPSLFLIGFNYNLFNSSIGSMKLLTEFRKEILSRADGAAENSFKAFIKSWKKVGDNLKTKMGFTLSNKSIHIGRKISLWNDYYIGYSTEKTGGEYYNFGMSISLSYLDYIFSSGFGGRWFSARNFLAPQIYGYETFDFSFRKIINWGFNQSMPLSEKSLDAKKFSINFGVSHSLPLGIWKSNWINHTKITTNNFFSYDLDFEMKLNNNLAYINTFSYWRTQSKFETGYLSPIINKEDAYVILSGISFSPFNSLDNFFISTRIGVLRLNPIPSDVYPKYSNLPIIVFSTGYKLNLFKTHFQLIPYFSFVTFFREAKEKDNLFSYKKIDYGLKIGYTL